MRKTIWDKRIPSILGLLFLAVSVGLFAFFGRNVSQLRGLAAAGETPKNVLISNITDTSFTVTFMTDDKVTSALAFGSDSTYGQIAMDDRDTLTGSPEPYRAHSISVTNLNPGVKYYFAIQSGSITALNNDLPFEASTASTKSAQLTSHPPATGTVNLPDGSIPLEGIVYISAENSQLLSVLMKSDGSYSLPLNNILTNDLSATFSVDPSTELKMSIIGAGGQSQVSLLAGQINPIPLITLSKDYDFTAGNTVSAEIPSASDSATASPSGAISPQFPVFDTIIASDPSILTPEEQEKFTDQQPTFSGTAIPNETVTITIESPQPIQATVLADSFGNWEYRPETKLDPGEHLISIVTKNAQGVLQTIERSFTVFAEGSQFNEPSVSPITTVSPTASASPILTITPTIPVTPTTEPTVTPNLTLTMAASLSLTPDPASLTAAALSLTPDPDSLTATARASEGSKNMPPSGNNNALFIAGIITVLSIAGGFVLFFF